MPYMTNGKRDYQKEYKKYNSQAHVVKKRVADNKARRAMIKAGKAKVGDGMDVDHKVPQSKGGSQEPSNLQMITASANRSFRRKKDGSLLSQISKKGT